MRPRLLPQCVHERPRNSCDGLRGATGVHPTQPARSAFGIKADSIAVSFRKCREQNVGALGRQRQCAAAVDDVAELGRRRLEGTSVASDRASHARQDVLGGCRIKPRQRRDHEVADRLHAGADIEQPKLPEAVDQFGKLSSVTPRIWRLARRVMSIWPLPCWAAARASADISVTENAPQRARTRTRGRRRLSSAAMPRGTSPSRSALRMTSLCSLRTRWRACSFHCAIEFAGN